MGIKRLAGAIWRGPFYVGPLSRPVSTGDALLKLLETIWRAIVVIFVIAIAGGAALAGTIWWTEKSAPPPISKTVKASISIDKTICDDPNYPLTITFDNPSEHTVESINFSITAREKGHSTNLNEELVSRESDQILPPKSTGRMCWSKPKLNAEVTGPIEYGVVIEWGSWAD